MLNVDSIKPFFIFYNSNAKVFVGKYYIINNHLCSIAGDID